MTKLKESLVEEET